MATIDMEQVAKGLGAVTAAQRPTVTRTSKRRPEDNPLYETMGKSITQAHGDEHEWTGTAFAVAPTKAVDEETLRKLISKAGRDHNVRVRTANDDDGNIVFWALPHKERQTIQCPGCNSTVTVTDKNTLRSHGPQADRCEYSGAEVAAEG
jgi:hypothetical protein